MNTFIALLALSPFAAQDPVIERADSMLNLATADQPLVHTAVVDATVREVWRAWTTTEGIKSWMVAEGDVDLKIGGKIRTAYKAGTDLNGPDAIENTIISFDPGRMLSIRNTKAPVNFPFKKAISEVWTVLYLEPEGATKSKVTVRMLGYRREQEFVQMRRFFMAGNRQTLDALVARFSKSGPKVGKRS